MGTRPRVLWFVARQRDTCHQQEEHELLHVNWVSRSSLLALGKATEMERYCELSLIRDCALHNWAYISCHVIMNLIMNKIDLTE